MIIAPTNCPCCDSILEWSNDQLYCRNTGCLSSVQKKIEHFASTMKIKGLGPSTIEKLALSIVDDIYDMSLEDITVCLKSEKMASKLYDEINISRSKSLNHVLPALGIPLIGKSATDKLSSVVTSLFDINEVTCKEAGLGEKATFNLLDWLNKNDPYTLPFSFEFEKKLQNNKTSQVVCISGKLTSYSTKSEAQVELEKLGFVVKSSLTKDVTILVNESGKETSKTLKARESGVLIVTNLKEFIGEYI